MNWTNELNLAIDIARGAGKIVLDHFGRVERLTKRHAEAVTDADRASQRFVVAAIRQRYPNDGIIGEENETGDAITFECPDPAGRVWVIDPIDGTNNFVAGLPIFGVCIGLLHAGRPVAGVVYDVCGNRMYTAAAGHGAFLNARPITAAKTPLDESSLFMITSNFLDKTGRVPGYVTCWLRQTAWKTRILGSAAIEACQVGAGTAHAAITVNGKLWDAAAAAAVVLEAGGLFTDLAGRPIFPFDLSHYDGRKVPFLAGAPTAHAIILRDIQENP